MRYSDFLPPVQVAEATLNERMDGWAILPATMVLYGKRTVSVIEAAKEWGTATILICTKIENDGRKRFAFISSANDDLDYYSKMIGTAHHCYHDQTGASKGMYTVVNVAVVSDGQIVKSANDTGLNVKASLSVFK